MTGCACGKSVLRAATDMDDVTRAFQQFEVSLTRRVTRLSDLNDRPSRGMAAPVAGRAC